MHTGPGPASRSYSRRRRGLVVVCTLLALGLTACAPAANPRSLPSDAAASPGTATVPKFVVNDDPVVVSGCLQTGDTALVLDWPRARTEALSFGKGDRAVILGHQAEQRPCAWAAFGRELAAQGWRVFIPRLNYEALPLLQASVNWLVNNGVTSYTLRGASMGGTFILSAAPDLDPMPSGAVAISAPATYGSADAVGAIGRIQSPVTLIAADGDDDFAEQAHELKEHNPSATLLIVHASEHGTELLSTNAKVRSAVLTTLESTR